MREDIRRENKGNNNSPLESRPKKERITTSMKLKKDFKKRRKLMNY
jgi:hypothetical protein